ncbi:MAG: CHAP domain-containing protein [Candidatus Dormibacteria bacterium]
MVPASFTTTPATDAGSSYVSLTPYRILDTRMSGDPLGPATTQNLTVTGLDSVPSDATAVVLNVTVTEPSDASYLTVYPAGEGTPNVSNLNFSTGETVANLTVVAVGTNGQVTIYNSTGTVQVVVDLEGYFAVSVGSSTAGSYVALTPARITDTRAGSGDPNSGHPLTPGGSLNVAVGGEGGVPSGGVTAVALNVTVTDTTQYSYLTAYPAGIAVPLSSNLNWASGATVANRVIVPLGTAGQVSFYNSQGVADLVVDVVGYFTDGTSTPSNAGLYYPMSPVRLLDTRIDAGTLEPNSYLAEQFAGVAGISTTASAVVANLTSTNATAPSFFSVLPSQAAPGTSDLNFGAGQTVPNLVLAMLNADGSANIYNDAGTSDAIVDVFGYFGPEATSGSGVALPCTTASLVASVSSSTQGTPVAVDAAATCPSGSQISYEYWYKPWYSSVWMLAESWTGSASYTFNTSAWTVGTYNLAMWASSGAAYQGDVANTDVVSEPTYQYPGHSIPSESALIGYMVDPANLRIVAECYAAWAAGRKCMETGIPGQCTFWAEINWDSPYFSAISGNADELPRSYTERTGDPVAATPSVGALVVWSGPGPFAGSSAGHVAVITAVATDGSSYTVSQMNWSDQSWDISTMVVPFNANSFASQGLLGFLPAVGSGA